MTEEIERLVLGVPSATDESFTDGTDRRTYVSSVHGSSPVAAYAPTATATKWRFAGFVKPDRRRYRLSHLRTRL